MGTHAKTEVHLEIAHILFIDAVGYSKLRTNEQRKIQDLLVQIVRASERFRAAEAAGTLMRLPTGDGMALVFSDTPESTIICALEICRAARAQPELQLRMGINSGPVTRLVDVNDRSNIAGAGMNMAERIMSCADANHILVSRRAAEDLGEYERWRPYLHDLGECEGKHGAKLGVVNFYTEEFGNPEPPARFRRHETRRSGFGRLFLESRRGRLAVAGIVTLVCLGLGLYLFPRYVALAQSVAGTRGATEPAPALAPVSAKSIAVLPFENRSDDQNNAFFADGVQDEILNDLAKVSDLKVISRTSVMQYRKTDAMRNLREIGQELGVAFVVQGSVQREGDRVRVSAQLIDARADKNVWAQRYDRKLHDVFALQSDLAEEIVVQLKARLSPGEKAAIEQAPTGDLPAYDLYLQARAIGASITYNARGKQTLFEAVTLLEQAVERDPDFLLAYCQLARMHDQIYLLGLDHSPERLEQGRKAVDTALRLDPDSGEAHLALAYHLYSGLLDYDRARIELKIAGAALPNEPFVYQVAGFIDRRQGRLEESIKRMEQALELDPRNLFLLQQISLTYESLRRYADMAAVLDRALTLAPADVGTRLARALVDLQWHADPRPAHAMIATILGENPAAASEIAQTWLYVALCERDTDAAQRALATMAPGGCRNEGLAFPMTWCEGEAARARGDLAGAEKAFTQARAEAQKVVEVQPNYAEALCVLGSIDAGLGRKEDALREGRRAAELLPISQDAINGQVIAEYLALIYTWTDEKDLALEQLSRVTQRPGQITYGDLRLHPAWDALRGDPRFEQIVATLAPQKAAAKNGQ